MEISVNWLLGEQTVAKVLPASHGDSARGGGGGQQGQSNRFTGAEEERVRIHGGFWI